MSAVILVKIPKLILTKCFRYIESEKQNSQRPNHVFLQSMYVVYRGYCQVTKLFPYTFTIGPAAIQPVITNQPVPVVQQQQQQQMVSTIQIVHTGNHCGCRHSFRSEFTCCGICCGIFLFPVGLICCFCMRKQRCKKCNLYA